MFNINKFKIFKTKFYLFYPVYEYVYKNKNFINHKSLNPIKIKTIMFKYLFVLPIYYDKLENLNIEHLWCKEWINNNKNNIIDYANIKNKIINDLHHLYLSNSKINSIRKNYKFDELNQNYEFINLNGQLTIEKYKYCKINKEKELFEPPNFCKDIIVRSFTYLLFRYPEFTTYRFSKSLSNDIYLKWFYLNKVSYNELFKNELIGVFQNNINIFVKYPILIPLLFDDSKYVFKNLIKFIPNQIYCLYTSFFIKLNLNYYRKINQL